MAMQAMAGIALQEGMNYLMGNASSGKASARQYAYNLALQKQAQQWNEFMYRNRYVMQVDDLKRAGINKLYGLGQAPAVTSGMNSVGLEDDQGNATARRRLAMDMMNSQVEMSARQAQTEKIKQETKTEEKNTQLKELESIGKQLENLKNQKDLDNYDKRLELELKQRQAEILDTMERAKTYESQINANNAQANNARANARKTQKETELMNDLKENDQETQKEVNKIYKNTPGLRKLHAWANVAGDLISPFTGSRQGATSAKKAGRKGNARK